MEDLSQIDARTDELLRQRTAMIGGGAVVPRQPLLSDIGRPFSANDPPPTTNPVADQLRFVPADEARDVAARLGAYTRIDESTARRLTLADAWRQTQRTGREYLRQEEEYVLAAIRLLIERHLWSPRFFNDTTVQVAGRHGSQTDAVPTTALQVINELRATQRLPFGGQIEAAYVYSLTDQLRRFSTDGYTSASQLILRGDIPLLRGAGEVAREDLVQAERELVYAARTFESFRRSHLASIAQDYFELAQLLRRIRNEETALASLRLLQERTEALVDAGRLRAFETSIAQNRVLSGTADVAELRERYVFALDQFKSRLGLPVDEALLLEEVDFDLPEAEVTPDAATQLALEYRLDLQTVRDRVEDARRNVRIARNGLLPDLNLFGDVNLASTIERDRDLALLDPGAASYTGGVTFGLPLDREVERLNLRQRTIGLERSLRDLSQARDNVAIEARSAVRALDVARFQFRLQERAVEINERRIEEQRVNEDAVDAQSLVDTADALRDAQNARDAALSDLRNAILGYLLSTGQLRVAPDGALQQLPGMPDNTLPTRTAVQPAPDAADAPPADPAPTIPGAPAVPDAAPSLPPAAP